MSKKTNLPLSELISLILQWGREKGLHETTDLKPQLAKLTEELGEIAAGVTRQDSARIIDSVGDFLVALIQFGAVHLKANMEKEGLTLEDVEEYDESSFLETCLNNAWNWVSMDEIEIKECKGQPRKKAQDSLPLFVSSTATDYSLPPYDLSSPYSTFCIRATSDPEGTWRHGPFRSLSDAMQITGEVFWGIFRIQTAYEEGEREESSCKLSGPLYTWSEARGEWV